MTAMLGHMAASGEMLAAYAIMGNIDKFSTVACFGLAGAAAVMVGKQIGQGEGREAVYRRGRWLLALSFLLGLGISLLLALALPTVFLPILYPLFQLTAGAQKAAVCLCVAYIVTLPLKAHNVTAITGIFRAGGDVRVAALLDLCPLWLGAVPLTALTALVLDAPVAAVCFCVYCEDWFKLPLTLHRLRSRKWINDVTRRKGNAP
jgi:Na+-driven multidrug efflux pump